MAKNAVYESQKDCQTREVATCYELKEPPYLYNWDPNSKTFVLDLTKKAANNAELAAEKAEKAAALQAKTDRIDRIKQLAKDRPELQDLVDQVLGL